MQKKIEFTEEFINGLDGTPEEVEQLMKELQELADTGKLFENAVEVDLDSLSDADLAVLGLVKDTVALSDALDKK